MAPNTIPLSLYIHIPWCIRKCPYCDFNSHVATNDHSETHYISCLLEDLRQHLADVSSRPLTSIFIGGGTPSLFKPESYQLLFEQIALLLPFDNDIEITLEANPGTFEQEKFKGYRQVGINRLSLGVQSFNDQHLKKLGRIHSSRDARDAIECAKVAGFDNINLDLMHSLPNQSVENAVSDLCIALSYKPNHISWYQLTIEPNSYFYRYPPKNLPSETVQKGIDEAGLVLLKDYQHYEVSAYCLNNAKSKHNLNYWLFGDYIGIGAGAHSKLSNEQHISRCQKRRLPKDYLTNCQAIKTKILTQQEQLFEFMLNTTRLRQNIDKSLIQHRTQLDYAQLAPFIEKAIKLELMIEADDSFCVSHKGHQFLNDLQGLFLLTEAAEEPAQI